MKSLVAVATVATVALVIATSPQVGAESITTPLGDGAVSIALHGQPVAVDHAPGGSPLPGDDRFTLTQGVEELEVTWTGAPAEGSASAGLRGFQAREGAAPLAQTALASSGAEAPGISQLFWPTVDPDGVDLGFHIGTIDRDAGADPIHWPDQWWDLGFGAGYDGISLPATLRGDSDAAMRDQFNPVVVACDGGEATWHVRPPACDATEPAVETVLPSVALASELQRAEVAAHKTSRDASTAGKANLQSLAAAVPQTSYGAYLQAAPDAFTNPTDLPLPTPEMEGLPAASPRGGQGTNAQLAGQTALPLHAQIPLAIAALALLSPLAVALYRRILPSKALNHPVRDDLLRRVRAHPGIHESQLAREMGLRHTHVQYHIRVLEEAGLLETRRFGGLKCMFELGRHSASEKAHAMADRGRGRELLGIVEAEPGIGQRELAKRVGMSESSAKWHLDRLEAAGLVRTERARGMKRAWASPSVMPPAVDTTLPPALLAAPPAPL